jgi:hypothetical protein
MKIKSWLAAAGLAALSMVMVLAGCGGGAAATSSAAGSFSWPAALHFAATGSSGEMKMVSWASVMLAGLDGPIIRVVNEPAWTNAYKDMAEGDMVLCQIDKSTLRDCVEAIDEYAAADGGPWLAGWCGWTRWPTPASCVRGNSSIYKRRTSPPHPHRRLERQDGHHDALPFAAGLGRA